MSIILMTLDAAPQVSQEAIDQERELDSRLEAKIQVGLTSWHTMVENGKKTDKIAI